MENEVLTAKEAAQQLGISVQTIMRLIRGGRLRAYKLTGGAKNSPYRVYAVSVEAFKREREAGPTEADTA